jgi:transcriptional regulator with XRE-family HTH domain
VTKVIHPVVVALVMRRNTLGLTRAQVAEKSGLSWSSVAAWERGRYSPTLASLVLWADALDVTINMQEQQ